jgi:hypothetical protein
LLKSELVTSVFQSEDFLLNSEVFFYLHLPLLYFSTLVRTGVVHEAMKVSIDQMNSYKEESEDVDSASENKFSYSLTGLLENEFKQIETELSSRLGTQVQQPIAQNMLRTLSTTVMVLQMVHWWEHMALQLR